MVSKNELTRNYSLVITRELAETFAEQAYIKASNAGANDLFGYSVAIDGDTLAVGANVEDSSTTGINSTPDELATDSGAVYVFTRSGTTWAQQAYIKASNPGAGDNFGNSVTIDGDTLAVGARYEDSSTTGINSTPDELATDSGAVYVFTRSGTTWAEQAYIKASNTGADDSFGLNVAIKGDTLTVGAPFEDSSTTGINSTPDELATDSGAVYVFTRSGATWAEQAYIKGSNTEVDDRFGVSVAIAGDTLAVGANGEDSSTKGINSTPNELAATSGAVYVFTRSGATWAEQAYIKASNTGASDIFGRNVSIDGDTLAVGANGEDSSTKGINSTPNELAASSGAVYVFIRSGTTWAEQAYIKASNTGAGDKFGTSIAIDGNTLAVGASQEDSITKGINSTPDELATDSGAVYVFTRSGTTWAEQAYMKATNPGAGDNFSYSVTIDGATIAVGAVLEDSSTMDINSMPDELANASGAVYVFK